MRDNGYKNTAYAVAELIDNSIQAESNYVQLLCAEKEEELASRRTKRIKMIAVLDNGVGMDAEVLMKALQFGNGTRLGRSNRSGIGRFGMGLPASSISQCKRVDVWSWQNGLENAYHTYLDVTEIKNGITKTIPQPSKKTIPDIWIQAGSEFGKTGTLIVWSEIDRLIWYKASTLIDNSELLIGRMYRKFLNEGKTRIRMAAFNVENPDVFYIEKEALPNDPCYIMSQTSCPDPYNNTPLFEPFGEEARFTVNFHNENHDVMVRFSYAKDEARAKPNAGSTAYGKHAAKNIGISIVRAGRELEIDQSMVIQYDPTERWWGVEVEFPPALDELMGVTNNKQSARNFTEIMAMVERDMDSILKSGKSLNLVKAELEEEGDPRGPLLEIAVFIYNQLNVIRKLLKAQTKGMKSDERYDTNAEKAATDMTDQRKQQGFVGTSDKDEGKSPEEKKEEITNELVESGIEPVIAEQLAANTVANNLKYLFTKTSLEGDAFFTVRPRGGSINVYLNTRHPAFDNLVEVLDESTDDCDAKELGGRLKKASEGLKLLLMAWARYEDELPDGLMKEKAQEARSDWGRIAKGFLRGYF
ncbi:ATP-binding protein [Brevibacillus brevis]|nr:ATP-binding protein [Brevibacillus brevis]